MLSQISESKSLDQEPVTTGSDSHITLSQMTQQQRSIDLRQRFAKKSVPLPHAATPTLCNVYPELANEIVAACLEHTTFVVKVWVNYDAAWKKFFLDRRVQDCGRLILSPKDVHAVRALAVNTFQVNRVRFEVGTAFSHLCTRLRRSSRANEIIADNEFNQVTSSCARHRSTESYAASSSRRVVKIRS